MLHRNARLTIRVRLEAAQQIEYGRSPTEAVKQVRSSRATASKFVQKHREHCSFIFVRCL